MDISKLTNLAYLKEFFLGHYFTLVDFLSRTSFSTQLMVVAGSILLSYLTIVLFKWLFKEKEGKTSNRLKSKISKQFGLSQRYLFPIILILTLSIAEKLSALTINNSWLISTLQTLAVVIMVNRLLVSSIHSAVKRKIAQTLVLPLTILFFMGWLDDISGFLETFKLSVGNIHLTLNGLFKTAIFGILLFWLGKASSIKGQTIIRSQKGLDIRSKELFAKLFEIGLYVLIFVLMLEIIGVDFTTLAVFGGALGLGLGFGLQSIASNFISGIIILLDRSLAVGDYIELEDGNKGTVRELNMRSARVETFEGKDILVPNEKFITSSFVNWTHQNAKQRYSLELQVAYDTDLHKLFDIIRDTISEHPQVLSGDNLPIEELPDAEISSFGDSGVNILIEFWMEGIDDGKNRVGADLLLMLWDAFKANNIQIPFPQREVKILSQA